MMSRVDVMCWCGFWMLVFAVIACCHVLLVLFDVIVCPVDHPFKFSLKCEGSEQVRDTMIKKALEEGVYISQGP